MFEFLRALKLDFEKAQVERELRTAASYLDHLKRLHQLSRKQTFSNSCMLPEMRYRCGCDQDGVSYWRDHNGAVTFDCCAVHRSRKQNLLRIGAEELERASTAADRALKKYHSAAQKRIRSAACLSAAGAGTGTDLYNSRVSRRTFRIGDYESLHYQLQLTDRKLQDMLTRKRLAEDFAPADNQVVEAAGSDKVPASWSGESGFVAPISTQAPVMPAEASSGSGGRGVGGGGSEPFDIWYDLADSQATPPIMLRWLSQHGNPYVANRATRTLNFLAKAS